MQRFDSIKHLEERAELYKKHFGRALPASGGKIEFPAVQGHCALGYKSKNSMMSRNYFLSLSSTITSEKVSETGNSICYLSRFGSWKYRGKDPVLKDVCSRIKSSKAISEQLRQTDVESVTLKSVRGELSLNVDLYGGGFTAVMLPPMKLPIGLPARQVDQSARLFSMLQKEMNKAS